MKFNIVRNILLVGVLLSAKSLIAQTGPTIDVWYGNQQEFGQVGNPQPYVNILGNVSDSDGISSLTYRLNGGAPLPLSLGPDGKRLETAGDFNIDIPTASLNVTPTNNSVEIIAVDGLSNSITSTVTVVFDNTNVWPLPYSIDWSTYDTATLSDAVQIVDGDWIIDSTGARSTVIGYDRHLNIGGADWENYEVTAPITINSFGTYFPYAGFQLRWNGNSDDPISGFQPKAGWFPLGAATWYNHQRGRLEIYNSEGSIAASTPFVMVAGVEYMFKARVETVAGSTDSFYYLKVWENSLPEPADWSLITPGGPSQPASGSVILISVRADVSFGNVDVVPIIPEPVPDSTLVSDDFSSGFDSSIWSYVDPQGDGSLSMSGGNTGDAWLNLSVPGGTKHDAWTTGIQAPHILQPANDTDFEVEAKFESSVDSRAKIQGILVKQDSSNFLRFDFYHNDVSTNVFAATIAGASASVPIDSVIPDGTPMYLRVKRVGDLWTQSYSLDGSNWTSAGTFAREMTVTEVGVHSSNAGANPAHTTSVDYFYNNAVPIVNEDPVFVAGGSITLSNIVVNTGINDAFVTWDTDVPSNSQVLFGETLFYELGSEIDETLVTSHSVTIPGLVADTNYRLRIISEDGAGGSGVSADVPFLTLPPPVIISSIQSSVGDDEATISWTTDVPASSSFEYGETVSYELGTVIVTALSTSHSVSLTGLSSDTTHHFRITVDDGSGGIVISGDQTFRTNPPDLSGLISDDFSEGSLGGSWTYVDPLGDGAMNFSGGNTSDAWLNISVPSGISHDPWSAGILAPHVLQSANDEDFEIEVKFESAVETKAQIQGIIVKQDADNFLRFDFYHNPSSTLIFAASISVPAANSSLNQVIPDGVPMFMRVKRVGDVWTQSYSYDGSTWILGGAFTYPMIVSAVGLHSSNAGFNPAHTASFDYFLNTSAPFIEEDPVLVAGGSILLSDVLITPDENEITVSWTTSVASSSEVVFGESAAYELGSVFDPALVTSHSAIVPGLTGDTFYHLRIISEDISGEVGVSEDQLVVTDPPPIVISNILAVSGDDEAIITWDTDLPASSEISFGETPAYGLGTVTNTNLLTSHSAILTGLPPSSTIHYKITVDNGSGVVVISEDYMFTTNETDVSGIVSDDFSKGLDPLIWTYADPQGDGLFEMTGGNTFDAWLNMSVPAGSSHDPWSSGILAPHVLQDANDTDFELEIKFESEVQTKAQIQGFLVKEDDNNFLRFDFYHNPSSTLIFAGVISVPSASSFTNTVIPDGVPLYMRVKRVGDVWTQSYSYDGLSWLPGGSFSHSMTVTEVGIHSSNAGNNPAHTTSVDYFLNRASPFVEEDPVLTAGGSILISNIGVVLSENDAVVTWNTDVPSSSEVVFGETVAYEHGSVSTVPLVTSHSITLLGLIGDTAYHFRIISEDGSGEMGVSEDQLFNTDPPPIVISDIQVVAGDDEATVTWTTDVPTLSEIAYGETLSYEYGSVTDASYRTSHSLNVVGLLPETLYNFQISAEDGSGTIVSSENNVFSTNAADASGITSDDFSLGILNTSVWTYVDPQGDGSLSFSGVGTVDAWVNMSVPSGSTHDPWSSGILAPHIIQSVSNTNFEIEVKFESAVETKAQIQGVLVKQDDNNFLRFDFYHNPSSTLIFAGVVSVPSASSFLNNVIPDGVPLYMRVKREGNRWTQSYSYDGAVWLLGGSFTHALTVSEIGLHSSNAGFNPAHTTSIDYFSNVSSPLVDEDPVIEAGGSIIISDILIVPFENEASVSWTTDVASSSEIVVGETLGYELDDVSDPALVTSHSLNVAGLSASTFHHLRIISEDGSGEIGISEDQTFTTDASPVDIIISEVLVNPDVSTALITWTTDVPATSEIEYGTSQSYELGTIANGNLVTSHVLELTSLSPTTTYHFKIKADDGLGGSAETGDLEFTTASPPVVDLSGLVSDDFSSGLDPLLWTYVDPQGDATISLTGGNTEDAWLNMSVPAGTTHDPWSSGILAPHVLQSANDTDFEIEVKFESTVSTKAQIQGVLVKQDSTNFLRFDFYHNPTSTVIFAASISVPSASSFTNNVIPDGVPLYLRVKREGNLWTQTYSYDGDTWLLGGRFTHAMTVTEVGLHSSNAGFNPAHTTSIDYFENLAAPLVNEDPVLAAGGNIVLSNIAVDPEYDEAIVSWSTDVAATSEVLFGESENYELGSVSTAALVTSHSLTLPDLVSDTLHHFRIISEDNGGEIGVSDNLTFTTDSPPLVISNIQVFPDVNETTITWTTDVAASSALAYGISTSYEVGTVSNPGLVASHSLTITGLDSDTTYHSQITADDGGGLIVMSPDIEFTTNSPDGSGLTSDDFRTGVLNTAIWTYVDPQGDGSLVFSGAGTDDAWLNMSVPAGSNHDPWSSGILAPHVMQATNNTDFEIEIKFESEVQTKAQIQGILVKEDGDDFLRFDFYHNPSSTMIFAAAISVPSVNAFTNSVIPDGVPLYMRVKRVGNLWTQSYSYDGLSWATGASFTYALNVTEVGVHSSNAGFNPAHTTSLDYFENRAAPLVDEDPVSP